MTKTQLQTELLNKVKAGIKPSQLKKSKSASDLPNPQAPLIQPRRKSIEPLTNPHSLTKQLELAQSEISSLGLQVEISQRELTEFQAENSHLKEQAGIKQKELENLRSQLESLNQELSQVKQELDDSQQARFNNLQAGEKERQKALNLKKELVETREEAASELIATDKKVSSLRTQLFKSQQEVNQLNNELKRARLKRNSANSNSQPPEPFLTNLKYALYALLTV
jgi:chromosome segregation ATPase